MRDLARQLLKEASRRGAVGFTVRNDLGKLCWGDREARRAGLDGLTDEGLLAAAEAEAGRVQKEVTCELVSTGLVTIVRLSTGLVMIVRM
jgi:hypothetical protein